MAAFEKLRGLGSRCERAALLKEMGPPASHEPGAAADELVDAICTARGLGPLPPPSLDDVMMPLDGAEAALTG